MIKKKLAKVLLSAALVLSILGNDFFYVGAGNPQEDTTSEVAEGVTNDVVENEQENEIQAEEVQPEENIVPDTPLPEVETEDGQVDSEVTVPDSEPVIGENGEVSEEAVATLSDEGEEEIPEITDEKVLMIGRDVPKNHDQVCQGGGMPNNSNSNPYNNGKPNQNPKDRNPVTYTRYWDYTNGIFNERYTEQDLINQIWPFMGSAGSKWKLRDAVITPQDKCYYANEVNGYGEEVHNSESYLRWDAWWNTNDGGTRITPRPNGMGEPHLGTPDGAVDPDYIKYAGNYYWRNRNGAEWAFRVVTRPVLQMAQKGHFDYRHPDTGRVERVGQFYIDGNSYPRIMDKTGKLERELDPKDSMYRFKECNNKGFENVAGRLYESWAGHNGESPRVAGWYRVTVQTPANKESFILPGVWTEKVMYMDKGYRIDYKQSIDNNNLQSVQWKNNEKPDAPDQNTKDLFGIDLYLHEKPYKIPEPSYDTNRYIFDGWEAREEYWVPADPGNPIDSGRIIIKTKQITEKDKDGKYIYRPTKIDDSQFFVLNSTLVAKLRTRKTNTVNVEMNFTNNYSNILPSEIADVNQASIRLVEGIQNDNEFVITMKDDYPFDFLGYSESKDNPSQITNQLKFKPSEHYDFKAQGENDKNTKVYATVTAKPMTIKLDPNGGTVKPGSQKPADINSYYYKQERIFTDSFVNKDLILKGWSETKGGEVKVQNGGTYTIDAIKENGKYPSEKILYAVWGKSTAVVTAKKHKDILFYPTDEQNLAANSIYADGSSEVKVYELGRFYLDVEPADAAAIGKPMSLKPEKFFVVIEHSLNGRDWRKLELNDVANGAIITKAFGKAQGGPFAKVIFDEKKQKWFTPILGLLSKMNKEDLYKGFYRISVAYDDDAAAEEVATEEEYFKNTKTNGWNTSDVLQVKVIQSADAMIEVPSSVTLEEKTEVDLATNVATEVIESVHKNNQVTVVAFEHDDNKKTDYDWSTPNNALASGKTGSYNDKLHQQFLENKPFYVTMQWDKTLIDASGRYKAENIEMYSSANIGTMHMNQIIPQGTKRSFTYDGTNSDKTLFDFYLKGDKPKGLPEGLQLKGTITFTVSPVAQ